MNFSELADQLEVFAGLVADKKLSKRSQETVCSLMRAALREVGDGYEHRALRLMVRMLRSVELLER